jgi:hypothetical protein
MLSQVGGAVLFCRSGKSIQSTRLLRRRLWRSLFVLGGLTNGYFDKAEALLEVAIEFVQERHWHTVVQRAHRPVQAARQNRAAYDRRR